MVCSYRKRDNNADALTSNATIAPIRSLSTESFTGDDLRFFHHFLLAARPHLPYGSEASWTTLVPAYSHECPHLMHAILSLGATHYTLADHSQTGYTQMAISHRGKSLQSLSAALSNLDNCTDVDLDGILATCYTLVFQAYFMPDGLTDFAVMVRGCGMVTQHIISRFNGSKMFTLQTPEQMTELLAPWLPTNAHPDHEVIDSCITDIDKLHSFLQSSGSRDFFNALRKIYLALKYSIRDAFFCLTEVYAIWCTMENHDFLKFIASSNRAVRVLFLHYIAIDTLMRPFMLSVRAQDRARAGLFLGADVMEKWAFAIYHSLPANMQELVVNEMQIVSYESHKYMFQREISGYRSSTMEPGQIAGRGMIDTGSHTSL
ncbi:unnamed protein product [Penicillium salamii]|uniref:Uncharacterized protein n=1 Tax=Penicillium salamii TaxID=1612424 RepID=A0A9W4NGN6_9EURO|nr:unnamed protein product [Penicillium salamii]